MHNRDVDAKPAVSKSYYPTSSDTDRRRSTPNGSRASRARVGIGSAHLADLLIPGAVAGKVVYLDDDGSPVVLCSRDLPFPSGRAGLRIALAGGGQLALLGRAAERPPTAEEARRIGTKLVDHRHCLTGLLDQRGAIPIRFEIETVLVTSGSSESHSHTASDAPPEMVPLGDYVDATPDLFGALGSFLAAHLTEDHQDLLLTAARRLNPDRDLLAVGARDVFAGGLTLDVVGADGSREFPVRFAREVVHPHQFGTALRAYAFEAS